MPDNSRCCGNNCGFGCFGGNSCIWIFIILIIICCCCGNNNGCGCC